ncbi:MAG: hypothetical protein A3A86_02375 [Elusimicrobia bacterium RIFCSPLOWO2_01_FULL_60_11]|nr:MAG: hypothetical protein A3A86_02375 [Elusimicrobia bacterium RIFCSPLOWO2_01_FULL_60_11]
MIRLALTERIDRKSPLAAFVFEKENLVLGIAQDKKLAGAAESEGFTGKAGTFALLHPITGSPSRLVLLVGLGPRKDADLEKVRRGAALAAKKFQALAQSSISIRLPEILDPIGEALAVSEGIILSAYSFDKYKQKKSAGKELKEAFLVGSKSSIAESREGVKLGHVMAESACFARDLVNEPPSDMTPTDFAERARAVAEQGKAAGITVKVFEKDEIEKMKMGALLGVARGSAEPPVFIHLHYKPENPLKSIALVGKGITFDSGGLSLKDSLNMETMKMDMAGAASILAVFRALPSLKPRVEIHGVLAVTENMPGGRAQKPGDILRAMNGKSIEVLNTDAEGRLVLADALAYAVKLKADAVIDIATLTGACVIALGALVAGAMGNNDELFREIDLASKDSGERFWQLPLVEDYKEGIKSPVADVKNISSIRREAGSIIGGLFLREFMDDTPWIHLDIAGPAWTDRELPYCKQGGTGFPVRTLLHYLLNQK